MRANTAIGEIAINEHLFRPSLEAMARIAEPRELVEVYALVMGGPALTGVPWVDKHRIKAHAREQFRWSLTVLYACAVSDDVGPLLGGINERMRYVPGQLPPDKAVILAQALLRHGITGDAPPEAAKAKGAEYKAEFNARDFAALAVAHLGLSETEAWAMTMTSLNSALRAKYPPAPTAAANTAPDEDEHTAAMAWLARVNAKRKAANHG